MPPAVEHSTLTNYSIARQIVDELGIEVVSQTSTACMDQASLPTNREHLMPRDVTHHAVTLKRTKNADLATTDEISVNVCEFRDWSGGNNLSKLSRGVFPAVILLTAGCAIDFDPDKPRIYIRPIPPEKKPAQNYEISGQPDDDDYWMFEVIAEQAKCLRRQLWDFLGPDAFGDLCMVRPEKLSFPLFFPTPFHMCKWPSKPEKEEK